MASTSMQPDLRERTPAGALKTGFASGWLMLGICCIAYLITFFYYYPPSIAGIDDEIGFVNQAIIWSKGAFTAEGAGFDQMADVTTVLGGRTTGPHVSYRNPGRSLIIIPFLIAGGVKAVFISGALIHLCMVLVGGKIFVRLGRSPLWAILLLCHPTLALYSRMIMGDEPAGLALLFALYAMVRLSKPGLYVGIAIGVAAIMRYHSGLVLPFAAVAIACTTSLKNARWEAVKCLIGGAAVGAVIAVYNIFTYGRALGETHQTWWAAEFITTNVTFYFFALMAIWPGMLLTPLIDRSTHAWMIRALTLPILCLFIPYYFHDKTSSFAQTLVVGQRLIQPALPVWVVGYGLVLGAMVEKWKWPRLLLPPVILQLGRIALVCVLMGAVAAIFSRHQQHLKELVATRDDMMRVVPEHSLVIGSLSFKKLIGVPLGNQNPYRWHDADWDGKALVGENSAVIQAEHAPWYFVLFAKDAGAFDVGTLEAYQQQYRMTKESTTDPHLQIFRVEAGK